jgi:membrane protease YdiL (CAAX protease family)
MFLENVFSGKNDIGRWLALILIVFISFQIIGLIPLGILMFFRLNDDPELEPDPENILDFSSYGISTLGGWALTMIPYILALTALLILIKPIHERSVKSLITTSPLFRWRNFCTGMLGWLFLLIIYSVIAISLGFIKIKAQFQLQDFSILLLLSLLLIPFQVFFEGAFFRGYLLQGLTALFQNRWIPVLISGILFSFFQYFHPEVRALGQSFFPAKMIWFGLFLGICVVMDEGLEMSLGVQLIHNLFYSVFFIRHTNAIPTPAFFNIIDNNSFIDLVGLIILSITFLLLAHKKFHWPSWRLLFSRVTKPTFSEEVEYLSLFGKSDEQDED